MSVNWESGRHPQRLAAAIGGSATVFSAWDNGELVGLINALDDGVMTAYVHFLLVNPTHQGRGIGTALLGKIKGKYSDYLRILLTTDASEVGYYENSGFARANGVSCMFINKY